MRTSHLFLFFKALTSDIIKALGKPPLNVFLYIKLVNSEA